MNDILKTCASHTDLKPRLFLYIYVFTCKCLVFLKFVNEGIVNIQVLCSIPLAWTWRYYHWYWQCLHIQTKGALITCINYCHLLELTLLWLVDLENWTSLFPILRVPGAFIFILFLIEIPVCKQWKSWSYVAFLCIWSGPTPFAYVHFYRTLCTSGLSNVPEILQCHIIYRKRNGPQRKIEPYVL